MVKAIARALRSKSLEKLSAVTIIDASTSLSVGMRAVDHITERPIARERGVRHIYLASARAMRSTSGTLSWAPLTTNGRRHSILRLACRTTFDHLSVSARMCAASSSDVLKVGSNPMVAIRSLMSGSAMIFAI